MKKQTNAKCLVKTGHIILSESFTKTSGNVPIAYWNRDNSQANLNRNDPDNQNANNGFRSSVEIFRKEILTSRRAFGRFPANCFVLEKFWFRFLNLVLKAILIAR